MLKRNDAVVIDVRNHYEAAIGRFDGQMMESDTKWSSNSSEEQQSGGSGGGGATYIDPKMRKSTDFIHHVASRRGNEAKTGGEDSHDVLHTGGIWCERASTYLNSQIGNKVNGVFQLKGGDWTVFEGVSGGWILEGKELCVW